MFTGLVDDVGVVERVERTEAGRELRVASRYADLADGREHRGERRVPDRARARGGLVHRRGGRHDARPHDDRVVGGRAAREPRARAAARRSAGRAHRAGARRRRRRRSTRRCAATTRCWSTSRCPTSSSRSWCRTARHRRRREPHGERASGAGDSSAVVDRVHLRHTTLGALRPGDGVHVEADMIGKYVRQLVAPYAAAR